MREEVTESCVDAVLDHEIMLEGAVLQGGQGRAGVHQNLLVRLHDQRDQRHQQRHGRLAKRRLRLALAEATDAEGGFPRHRDRLLRFAGAELPDLCSLVIVGLMLVGHSNVEHLQDIRDRAARQDPVAQLHRCARDVGEDLQRLLAGAGRGRQQQVLEDVDGAVLDHLLGLPLGAAGEVGEHPERLELQLVALALLGQLQEARREARVDDGVQRGRVRALHLRAQLACSIKLLSSVLGAEPLQQGRELLHASLILELPALLATELLLLDITSCNRLCHESV
mmetsp:Transcript_125723/g.367360  ORF Transcript_125723/g.367360 Transcript_125723/m.367360 type:complete len:281 (+) Transcript_125723:175-1017(+)